MRKNDIIVIAALAVIALVSFGAVQIYSGNTTKEAEAVVLIDGKEQGRYPLSEDITVEIEGENGGYNILDIKAGMADITEASCPDKICVNHKPINKNGETLVCLPNKVVVEIQNGEEAEVDGATN